MTCRRGTLPNRLEPVKATKWPRGRYNRRPPRPKHAAYPCERAVCLLCSVLDGVDPLHDQQRYRVRSHDLYGPLPTIEIEDTGDRLKVVDDIHREAAKLSAIHGLRKELVEMFEDATFLEPTLVDEMAVVGISYGNGEYTTMAEGTSFLDAYDELRERVIDETF